MISWTVDLGTIIQMVGFLITAVVIVSTVRGDVKNVKEDVVDIKKELRTLREVITTQATQTVRLDLLAKRLDKVDDDFRLLRQGEGFVLPFPHRERK